MSIRKKEMKHMIASIVCTVMVLTMIPVVSLNVSAAGEGIWTTYRAPSGYEPENADSYTPAAGYQYTSEGFQTISPDFTNCTVYYTVQTKETVNAHEGVYLRFRMDDFSYRGPAGNADEWITITLWDTANLRPGLADHGSGAGFLIRGNGDGQANAFTSICTEGYKWANNPASVAIRPEVDSEGREIYTLEISYGADGYDVNLCGSRPTAVDEFSNQLNFLSNTGDLYVGITVYSGTAGGTAALTITDFGTSRSDSYTPTGSDSKDPDENVNVFADIADASAIPEGQPAMLWDATKSSFRADPLGQALSLTALGDNSYHCVASAPDSHYSWTIASDISYAAEDVPVFAMLLRNFYGSLGALWPCAGEVLAPGPCTTTWSLNGVDSVWLDNVGDDGYNLVVVNLDGKWEGRINQIRVDFNGITIEDEFCEWDICWMGMFRTVDDAVKYTEGQLKSEVEETDAETDPALDSVTDEETGSVTEVPETVESAVDTADNGGSEKDTNDVSEKETAEDKSGCQSALSSVVILAAMIAASVLSVKRRKQS